MAFDDREEPCRHALPKASTYPPIGYSLPRESEDGGLSKIDLVAAWSIRRGIRVRCRWSTGNAVERKVAGHDRTAPDGFLYRSLLD